MEAQTRLDFPNRKLGYSTDQHIRVCLLNYGSSGVYACTPGIPPPLRAIAGGDDIARVLLRCHLSGFLLCAQCSLLTAHHCCYCRI